MKKKPVFVFFLLLVAVLCARAAPNPSSDESRLSFFIEPILLKGLGGTAYDLYAGTGGGESVLSRLEFPAASLEAGVNAGLSMEKNGRRTWLFEASIAHSTLPWQARMYDYDWHGKPGGISIPWSYTYSNDTTTS